MTRRLNVTAFQNILLAKYATSLALVPVLMMSDSFLLGDTQLGKAT